MQRAYNYDCVKKPIYFIKQVRATPADFFG